MTTSEPKPKMRLVPIRLRFDDHEVMRELSFRNRRSIVAEYRAAIAHWLKKHEARLSDRAAA